MINKELIKKIYHVIKINNDKSFVPITNNIIYTGEWQDVQEIFSKRIAELPNKELYAIVLEERRIKVLSELSAV